MHPPTLLICAALKRVGCRMWRGRSRPSLAPTNQIQGPGPRRMLGCTLYALASLRALAAEVKRLLLPLLARLGVDPGLA
jgi:hypothetical protein